MKLISFLLIVLAAGCATTRMPLVDAKSEISAWKMQGRLAATIGQEGGSATFIWQKQKNKHQIELYGPLGSGRVMLHQDDNSAVLIDSNHSYNGTNLQEVLFKKLGWLVPFEDINHWLTGKPGAGRVSGQIYEDSQLISFIQRGWLVEYKKFKTFAGITIPSKLTLTATMDYLNDLSFRLNQNIENAKVKFIIQEFKTL